MVQPIFPSRPRPLLFAHRGASLLAPENTMEAFDLGMRLGADVLEMDVHLTRDNEVVVLHDARLERTTDGSGLVREKTYAELLRLDAGCRFLTRHGGRHFGQRGVIIPRLEDVLRAFGRCAFNIEIKQATPAMIPQLLAILMRTGTSEVLLAAADDQIMATLEAARPGCALGLSRSQAVRVVRGAYVGGIPEIWRGRALQIPPRHRGMPIASTRVLRAAQAAGLEVHLWTINDAAVAQSWLARGVAGVMSDDPGTLSEAFAVYRETSGKQAPSKQGDRA